MKNTAEDIADVRQKRLRRWRAAELLEHLDYSVGDEDGEDGWSVLYAVPDWCFWPMPQRERLTLISGALFIAPSIRMWIDGKRIKQAKNILGERCFDLVIAHFSVPHETLQLPETDDVRELLLGGGASVLLSAANDGLRGCLASLLPQPMGSLPQNVAQPLMAGAMSIMATADEVMSPSDKDEDSPS